MDLSKSRSSDNIQQPKPGENPDISPTAVLTKTDRKNSLNPFQKAMTGPISAAIGKLAVNNPARRRSGFLNNVDVPKTGRIGTTK